MAGQSSPSNAESTRCARAPRYDRRGNIRLPFHESGAGWVSPRVPPQSEPAPTVASSQSATHATLCEAFRGLSISKALAFCARTISAALPTCRNFVPGTSGKAESAMYQTLLHRIFHSIMESLKTRLRAKTRRHGRAVDDRCADRSTAPERRSAFVRDGQPGREWRGRCTARSGLDWMGVERGSESRSCE